MTKISILGVLSNIQMIVHTALKGAYVGTDQLGNKYYRSKPRKGTKQERRWVMFRDKTEATLVPPEWHGWLHRQTDEAPAETNKHRRSWIRPHQPNMTGTLKAYQPPQPRPPATGDYIPWQPPQ